MQLCGTGVGVSVGYPPDTDTPGYASETLTKPDICKAVNQALGSTLFPASKVRSKWCGGGVWHVGAACS